MGKGSAQEVRNRTAMEVRALECRCDSGLASKSLVAVLHLSTQESAHAHLGDTVKYCILTTKHLEDGVDIGCCVRHFAWRCRLMVIEVSQTGQTLKSIDTVCRWATANTEDARPIVVLKINQRDKQGR